MYLLSEFLLCDLCILFITGKTVHHIAPYVVMIAIQWSIMSSCQLVRSSFLSSLYSEKKYEPELTSENREREKKHKWKTQ